MSVLGALRRRLGWKLLLSYLIVVGVGVIVLALAAEFSIPRSFDRHLASMQSMMQGQSRGMSQMGPDMMQPDPGPLDLEQDLFSSYRLAVNDSLLTAAGIALVVAVAISIFISRRVVEPVRAMTAASHRIAQGEYRERVELSGSQDPDDMDELAQLAVSFNQMAAKLDRVETMRRQLIGDVAHELRTPLTTIKGSMEGLIDGVIEPGPEAYHQVYLEADRLQRLVGDLQELSRAEAGDFELKLAPAAPKGLIEAAVDRISLQFQEKGVVLETEVEPSLPPIRADADRIGQVLLNLAGNALQYTAAGGTVTLAAEQVGDEVRFQVRDTGAGISAEHLPHVFDRFYRVDKSRSRASGGSGIGLTIAKHIVEAHGGRIWAESDGPGKGSTFSFALQIAGGSGSLRPI